MHLLLEFAPDIHPSKFINTLKTITLRVIIKNIFYLDMKMPLLISSKSIFKAKTNLFIGKFISTKIS
ncbi:hypothetical protein [Borreliella carolinensis]|uniref:hypothetical protein n=1 Tax=Borreliella carolinensis TaxID=478174 RepID=UPI003AF07E04